MFYISSNSYSSMTPGALLLQACFTQRRLVIHLFLMGLAPSKCTKWSETKDTESLSLKSVQGAFLSLISRYPPKRRHGVKIHQRECQFAQIPFFRGSERSKIWLRSLEFLKLCLSLICRSSIIWHMYCWLEEETVQCSFLTCIIKYTKICF